MKINRSILILGAGEFGLTAALELRRRGWAVTVLDPGPVPRDTAASTDISKVVRCDYGADEPHTALGEAALAGWDLWNCQWGAPLYHADGFLVLTRDAMQPGGFEHESFAKLTARGHRLERMNSNTLRDQHPAWAAEKYPDGYFNPRGGWAESGKVIARLAAQAKADGVIVREGVAFARLDPGIAGVPPASSPATSAGQRPALPGSILASDTRITGIVTTRGEELRADFVLVAAGAWTPTLLPQLSGVMWATGQPVLHLKVADPRAWQAPRFPVWAADIARTGWYGFPALADGTLKIANHGPGRRVHPDEPRVVLPEEIEKFRAFFRDSLPALADAPLLQTRLCLYCDTFDGAFWIDHDPLRPGLIVAAGDSGHAFKFAPVLGGLIADVVEKKPNPFAWRYAWREPKTQVAESARAG